MLLLPFVLLLLLLLPGQAEAQAGLTLAQGLVAAVAHILNK